MDTARPRPYYRFCIASEHFRNDVNSQAVQNSWIRDLIHHVEKMFEFFKNLKRYLKHKFETKIPVMFKGRARPAW